MKTKTFLIICAAATICALSSCSKQRPEYYERVEAAAIRDVAKVIDAKENSMEREHAVLAIRVRHNAMKANGYDDEAELYLNIARHILVDSLHFIEDRAIVNEY